MAKGRESEAIGSLQKSGRKRPQRKQQTSRPNRHKATIRRIGRHPTKKRRKPRKTPKPMTAARKARGGMSLMQKMQMEPFNV